MIKITERYYDNGTCEVEISSLPKGAPYPTVYTEKDRFDEYVTAFRNIQSAHSYIDWIAEDEADADLWHEQIDNLVESGVCV